MQNTKNAKISSAVYPVKTGVLLLCQLPWAHPPTPPPIPAQLLRIISLWEQALCGGGGAAN